MQDKSIESVSKSRVAVAEEEFGNSGEGERPPLEAASRRQVKTHQAEKT
jgi:hypothetical protein